MVARHAWSEPVQLPVLTLVGTLGSKPASLNSVGPLLIVRSGNAEVAGYWDDHEVESVGPSPSGAGAIRLTIVGPDEPIVFETTHRPSVDAFLEAHPATITVESDVGAEREVVTEPVPPETTLRETVPPEAAPPKTVPHETTALYDDGGLSQLPPPVGQSVHTDLSDPPLDPRSRFEQQIRNDIRDLNENSETTTGAANALDALVVITAAVSIWNLGRTAASFLAGDAGFFQTLVTGFGWFVSALLVISTIEAARLLGGREMRDVGFLGRRPWTGSSSPPEWTRTVLVVGAALGGVFLLMDALPWTFEHPWYDESRLALLSPVRLALRTLPLAGLCAVAAVLSTVRSEEN